MRFLPHPAFLILATPLFAQTPDGKTLFEQNCAACHMPDQMVVGPSLVEIKSLYEKKPADFVKWCVAPKKKRENVIEMPSMAHLGEPALLAIHAHILAAAKGLSEKKVSGADPYAVPPALFKRPAVQRIFLPDAGPAAIAVALPGDLSYAWDAGPCRLRYVWRGGFINGFPYWKGNGSSLAEISGAVILREEKPLFGSETPKFLGYNMKDGLPVFEYRVGPSTVNESVTASGKTLRRDFRLSPGHALSLTVSPGTQASAGKLEGATLTLTAEQSRSFSLTQTLP